MSEFYHFNTKTECDGNNEKPDREKQYKIERPLLIIYNLPLRKLQILVVVWK